MSIILEHLNKAYGAQQVVRDLSLEIEAGELFVLLGASGSGKSTLLRMIAGLTPLDSGRILLNGTDVTHLPPQKRGTGFVFQNYSLFRHMNVSQNIEFGLSIRRRAREERKARVRELLELIDLPQYGDRMPTQLSGGQQQRVAIARALANDPPLLLADEPTGNLDTESGDMVMRALRDLQKNMNTTVVIVTHDMSVAAQVDRLITLLDGRIAEDSDPRITTQIEAARMLHEKLSTQEMAALAKGDSR